MDNDGPWREVVHGDRWSTEIGGNPCGYDDHVESCCFHATG